MINAQKYIIPSRDQENYLRLLLADLKLHRTLIIHTNHARINFPTYFQSRSDI